MKKYIIQIAIILLLTAGIAGAQIGGITLWYLDGTTLKPVDPTWSIEVSGVGDVNSVGDCTSGACLDGTSDGGTWIKFYDAQGAGQLITGNLTAAKVWTLPDETGTILTSVSTASALTSVGTLTALQVDNININANTISATTGAVNITPATGSAIVLDGTISIDAGVVTGATSITSTGFTGDLTGNASTATALANDPADCAAGNFATAINASGTLTCSAETDPNVNTEAEIEAITGAYFGASKAVTGGYIWVADGTDFESVVMSNDCTIASGGAITCDHDALDNFVANEHLDWTASVGTIHTDNYIENATHTGDVTGSGALTIANDKVLEAHLKAVDTASDEECLTYESTTGDFEWQSCGGVPTTITVADTTDTTAYVALFEDATGDLGPKTDAGITYNAGTGMLTATGFTGPLTGTAASSTELAANPTDCAANQFAQSIVASGNLTCAAIADADVPDTITIDLAATATALAANPADCAANNFAYAIDASGTLTCSTIDISSSTNLAAGRSLTMSGDSVELDSEIYTATKNISILLPTTADTNKVRLQLPTATTLTRVACHTDEPTSLTIQLDTRDQSTPNTAGTSTMSASLVCADTTASTTSFASAAILARDYLNLSISAASGTPAFVNIGVEYTIDD